MSTFTASQLRAQVAAPHTGNVDTGGAVAIAATGTAASVIMLCRVPNHCTITDWWFRGETGGANQVVILGTSATPSGLSAGFSLSGAAEHRAPEGGDKLPIRISLSDDVTEPKTVWLQAELAVALSASALVSFRVTYTMDRALLGHTTIR